MDTKKLLDLYTDFLICSTGLVTATGLSLIVDKEVSHDQITRMLSKDDYTNIDLWKDVKPLVRKLASTSDIGFLIIDDTIEEKPYTDMNELINYHYSHSKHMHVKGINILSALIRYGEIALPIDYHLIKKDVGYIDKDDKTRYKSSINKNEVAKSFIQNAISHRIKFEYVLSDIWFSSANNMSYVNSKNKYFIFGCKSNRLIRFNKVWHKLNELPLTDGQIINCYIKDVDFPVAITKKVFTNEDLSTGALYLISNNLELSGYDMYQIYQKRWIIEEFHKSIKQNASLAKSPTKTIRTQSNHVFCTMLAFIKLERLKLKTNMNHFAIKTKLYINATKTAIAELTKLRMTQNMHLQIC